ncbi:MAG: hypothetical protein ACERKN_00610 [Velocimicrobium sp.]
MAHKANEPFEIGDNVYIYQRRLKGEDFIISWKPMLLMKKTVSDGGMEVVVLGRQS